MEDPRVFCPTFRAFLSPTEFSLKHYIHHSGTHIPSVTWAPSVRVGADNSSACIYQLYEQAKGNVHEQDWVTAIHVQYIHVMCSWHSQTLSPEHSKHIYSKGSCASFTTHLPISSSENGRVSKACINCTHHKDSA